ncbi:unnamed protein product [Kuraishia capsulata CBS 1993]|uniref:Amino acid permease/ SLC12A domain-containing protein n=1 Tax=Kuraishia capsulata CBS 1993 TaxID=1382522 RepID=W6MXU7_9ASCO|nr:uncharacterized protein KUCA_T00005494001 [Kuraishia capsulata CBS 1993]CDK29505.1 unnamed protein product [Kuraishia capsulata CBS 1993]
MSSSNDGSNYQEKKLKKDVSARVQVIDTEDGETCRIIEIRGKDGLERNFDIWGVVGVVYSSIATPLTLGTYLSTVIGVGGAPFFFYSYLFTGFFCLLTAYSIAEMASVNPHSSAMVYWTHLYAPKNYARFLAYASGILSCACWIFGATATSFFISDLVLGVAVMRNPEYVSQTYHYYLVFLANTLLSAVANIFAVKWIPFIARLVNYIFNLGTLFTLVALLARAHPKQTASFAFTEVTNLTGWSSNGVVFFLSILPGVSALSLFDGACHMTDEVPNPKKNIPRVISYGYTGAFLVGLVAILVYNFCIVSADNLLDPVGGIPLFQLYVDSLHNDGLALTCALIIAIGFPIGSVPVVTSASRLLMSFADFGSIPYGVKVFGSVNPGLNSPVWAIVFVSVAEALIGLLYFASSAALNAVSGSFVSAMYLGYSIPFLVLILRKDRFGKGVKPLFNLGTWGRPINIICFIWFFFASAWTCVPMYVPVTASGMNYTVVVLFATFVITVTNWYLYAKQHFSIDVFEKMEIQVLES